MMDPAAVQILGMLITGLVSVLVALVSSSGFWTRMEKKSGLNEKIDEIEKSQKVISEKIDVNEVKSARRHILRFNDELLKNQRHTKEYFDDVLADCDTYDKYCQSHLDFPNNRTKLAEENIKRTYQKCQIDQDFL
jgi:hypothetical protein